MSRNIAITSSPDLRSVPTQPNMQNGPRPLGSVPTYPEAPPSYNDIYPSNPGSGSLSIPGDHKIQYPDRTGALHGYRSDSSIPSLDSRGEHSGSISSAEDTDDDSILAQALEFTSHPAPAPASITRLRQPIAIPQAISGVGEPFTRSYSPQLAAKGIGIDEFVEFIDNLNVVSAGSPPLQVLSLAGGILGMTPMHNAMAIGTGIQMLAKLGTVVVSKFRGTTYMEEVNEKFFAPRGLQVELVTGDALRAKLGLAPDAPLSVPVEVAGDMSVHQRRVMALRGHASDDLTFDVPPPNAPSTVLDKMCAAQQNMKLAKYEKKALRRKEKYHQKQEKYEEASDKVQKGSGREARKLEKKLAAADLKKERKMERILSKGDRKMDRELEKLERRHAKKTSKIDRDLAQEHREHMRDQTKLDQKLGKGDKEAKRSQKVLWIYIDNL